MKLFSIQKHESIMSYENLTLEKITEFFFTNDVEDGMYIIRSMDCDTNVYVVVVYEGDIFEASNITSADFEEVLEGM